MVQGRSRAETRCGPVMRLFAAAVLLSLQITATAAADDPSSRSSSNHSALTAGERALVAKVPYSNQPMLNRSGRFDTQFAMAPDTDWRKIYERPVITNLSFDPAPKRPRRMLVTGDVEGVFPINPKYLFRVLTDYPAYPQISEQTVYSGLRSTLTGMFAYHKRVQKVVARFLGLGETFLFVTNDYAMQLGKGRYGLKWNLERSLDGKLYSLSGSWYLQAVRCGEHTCSYLRYFNQTGLAASPRVPTWILSYFTGNALRDLLVEFYRAAARLRDTPPVARASR